jgi:hypothetical protein
LWVAISAHKADINVELHLQSTEGRAISLTVDYIFKAIKNTSVITALVKLYFQQPGAIPIVKGAHSHAKPRPTILNTALPQLLCVRHQPSLLTRDTQELKRSSLVKLYQLLAHLKSTSTTTFQLRPVSKEFKTDL